MEPLIVPGNQLNQKENAAHKAAFSLSANDSWSDNDPWLPNEHENENEDEHESFLSIYSCPHGGDAARSIMGG